MKTQPVVPARIDWNSEHGAPFAADFGDVYHPREGALAQARHVFVSGNRLPERWRGRERLALLEIGFGLGHNFLALWSAWRDDPHRCKRLVVVSIDKHPPAKQDLERAHRNCALPDLARALVARWPPLTPNLHRLAFDGGKVELLLLFADVADALPEVVGRFDAFMLDGFAPAKNPAMWQPRVFAALHRLAAPGATAATWSVAREVRDGLAHAGFAVERAAGFGAKREMTVATFAPRFIAPPPPGRAEPIAARDAIVVGAGLAGSAAARALVEQGFDVTMVAMPSHANASSSQPGGLFHGIAHGDDGPHARFTRAAALLAASELRAAIEQRGVAGSAAGVLRIESARPDLARMQQLLRQQALPSCYAQALDRSEAEALAGVAVAAPAWFFPSGGWIDARALCHVWRGDIDCRAGTVAALRRAGERWQLLDGEGRVIDAASVVVLAGGAAGAALLGRLGSAPLAIVRGQTTCVPADTPGLHAPALPIADAGYALTLADASVLCGASSSSVEGGPCLDAAPRASDRRANLQRLQRLTGSRIDDSALQQRLQDAVGFRLVSRDRLPLVGALPDTQLPPSVRRLDQPRFVPRAPGLYVLTALGSRGITWAPLCARLLAAQIAGSPWPLEASLVDAVDPGRFVARAVRAR